METRRNTVRKSSRKGKIRKKLDNKYILRYVTIPIISFSLILGIGIKVSHGIKVNDNSKIQGNNVQAKENVPQQYLATNTKDINFNDKKNVITNSSNLTFYDGNNGEKTYFNNGDYCTAEWISIRCHLSYMAQKDLRVRSILDDYKNYPLEFLTLLCNNPETLEFVYNYLYLKDGTFTSPINEKDFTRSIPDVKQWDKRWGYASYGSSNIAISGCAPTSLAMVVVGLTGEKSITPYSMAKYSEEKGYYIKGIGTSWNLITDGCRDFGVESKSLYNKKELMIQELESGRPIICSMLPGQFTAEGHFIVISGYENGKFIINDPNSIERSAKLWTYEEFYKEINALWSFKSIK